MIRYLPFAGAAVLLAGVCITACREPEPIFPLEPRIEFVSVTPDTVQSFGACVVRFSFEDGDGDLGRDAQTDETKDCFVVRVGPPPIDPPPGYSDTLTYTLPTLDESGDKRSIRGEVSVTIASVPLVSAAEEEEIYFELYVFDRAGRRSNTIRTTPVLVRN